MHHMVRITCVLVYTWYIEMCVHTCRIRGTLEIGKHIVHYGTQAIHTCIVHGLDIQHIVVG